MAEKKPAKASFLQRINLQNFALQLVPILMMKEEVNYQSVIMLLGVNVGIPLIMMFFDLIGELYEKWLSFKAAPPIPLQKFVLEKKIITRIRWYLKEKSKAHDTWDVDITTLKERGYACANNVMEVTCVPQLKNGTTFEHNGDCLTIEIETKEAKQGEIVIKNETVYMSCRHIDNARAFIKEVCDAYSEYHYQEELKNRVDFTRPSVYNFEGDSDGGRWKGETLNVNKTFKNVIISEKDYQLIMNQIKKFEDPDNYYERVGKPKKMGFLFYGIPGTGKSSTIYAIAHHMKRNIYKLDVSKVNSSSEFQKIIARIPKGAVVVMEEIDLEMYGEIKKEDDNTPAPLMASKPAVGLKDILVLLDGYYHLNECILIMTTNHKERLDAAMVRSGRIDLDMEFGRCDPLMISKILDLYFRAATPAEELKDLDDKYASSKIISFCETAKTAAEAIEQMRKQLKQN